jgi:hypothetical protein
MLLLFQWYAATDDKKRFSKICDANGFVIGSLPEVLHWTSTNGDRMKRKMIDHEITDLLKAMLVPVRPYGCVSSYSGGAQKSIKGSYQFLKWIKTELVEL